MYLNPGVDIIYLTFFDESVLLSNNAYVWEMLWITNIFIFQLYEPNRNIELRGSKEITNYFN